MTQYEILRAALQTIALQPHSRPESHAYDGTACPNPTCIAIQALSMAGEPCMRMPAEKKTKRRR